MKIGKKELLGAGFAIMIIAVDFIFFLGEDFFYFILAIGAVIGGLPFVISVVIETGEEREKDEMFLEFSRDLVEGVRSGTPISKNIINLREKDYGSLSPHIKKLANQISLGIPVKDALRNFAYESRSKNIKRAVTLIKEAEKAGGDIGEILEAVAKSVGETEKLKKERRAAIYNLVVQGYIIFLVFIVIMLIMQFRILGMAGDLAGGGEIGEIGGFGAGKMNFGEGELLSSPIFLLLLIQGFFAGLTIGKLSEGSIKAGIKHSFILVVLAVLISTGANMIFG